MESEETTVLTIYLNLCSNSSQTENLFEEE